MDIMHKYQFRSLERWADAFLQFQLLNRAYDANSNPVNSPDVLTRLFYVAARSQSPALRNQTEQTWVSYVWRGSMAHVLSALDASERHGSRALETAAYRYILKSKRTLISPESPSLGLSAMQRMRLAVGFLNLTNLWTTLESPPTFDCKLQFDDPTLGELARITHSCKESWSREWKAALVDLRGISAITFCPGGDIIGSLVELQCRLQSSPASSSPCFREALSTLVKLIEDLNENFLDHFALPPDITSVSTSLGIHPDVLTDVPWNVATG